MRSDSRHPTPFPAPSKTTRAMLAPTVPPAMRVARSRRERRGITPPVAQVRGKIAPHVTPEPAPVRAPTPRKQSWFSRAIGALRLGRR